MGFLLETCCVLLQSQALPPLFSVALSPCLCYAICHIFYHFLLLPTSPTRFIEDMPFHPHILNVLVIVWYIQNVHIFCLWEELMNKQNDFTTFMENKGKVYSWLCIMSTETEAAKYPSSFVSPFHSTELPL